MKPKLILLSLFLTMALLAQPLTLEATLAQELQSAADHGAKKPDSIAGKKVETKNSLPRIEISSETDLKYSGYSREGRNYFEVRAQDEPNVQIERLGSGFGIEQMARAGQEWIILISLQPGFAVRIEPSQNLLTLVVDKVSERQVISTGPSEPRNQDDVAYVESAQARPASLTRASGNGTSRAPDRDRLSVRPRSELPISSKQSEVDQAPHQVTSLARTSAPTVTVSPPATPQASLFNIQNEPINQTNLDLSVPESPAFTVLGVTPQTVVRPANPREFATSFLNGRDANGNFQTGVAIDTAPFLLAAGNNLTIGHYRDSALTRLLTNIQLSFATAKAAADDDKAVRLAAGVHLTLFDRGDPRLDKELSSCFENSLVFPPRDPNKTPEENQILVLQKKAQFQQLAEDCRSQARKRNWNRSSFIVGVAPSWISKDGSFDTVKWNGGALWTSLAWGFENVPMLKDTSQLILHARYRTEEQVPVPDVQNQFFLQDSLVLGGRFRIGRPDFAANLEGSFINSKPAGKDSIQSYRILFGAEKKLNDNLWFQLSLGGEGGREDGKNKGLVLTSFKYAFSKASSVGSN